MKLVNELAYFVTEKQHRAFLSCGSQRSVDYLIYSACLRLKDQNIVAHKTIAYQRHIERHN
jgi:hypothetical protein